MQHIILTIPLTLSEKIPWNTKQEESLYSSLGNYADVMTKDTS